MKKFFQEFKEFALKGNVIDLAVAVVIGGAFGAIVTSLINDIIMPLIGLIIKVDFAKWFIPLGEVPADLAGASADALAEAGISVFHYGKFIAAIIYFILIALAIFIVVRAIKKAEAKIAEKKKKEVEAAPAPRLCPFCRMEIAADATRCPHCTSLIEDKEVL